MMRKGLLFCAGLMLCCAVMASDGIETRLDDLAEVMEERRFSATEEGELKNMLAMAMPLAVRVRAASVLAHNAYYKRDEEKLKHFAEKALKLSQALPDKYSLIKAGALDAAAAASMNQNAKLGFELSMDAIALRRQLPAEEHDRLVRSLVNAGTNAALLGWFRRSEELLLEAIATAEEHQLDPRKFGRIFNNLGALYMRRGQWRSARTMFQRALEIAREHRSQTRYYANRLSNLGEAQLMLGLTEAARQSAVEALEIQRRLVPNSIDTAYGLYTLAGVLEKQGRFEKSLPLYREALSIVENLFPDSLEHSNALLFLADNLLELGRLDKAQETYAAAAEFTKRQAPWSSAHADTLHGLASVARRRDQIGLATELLIEATDVLELQYDLIGGGLSGSADFSREYQSLYKDLAILLIQQRQAADAIDVLERFRERTLLRRLGVDSVLRAQSNSNEYMVALDKIEAQARSTMDRLEAVRDSEQARHFRGRLVELRHQQVDIARQAAQTYRFPFPGGATASVLANIDLGDTAALYFVLEDDYSFVILIRDEQGKPALDALPLKLSKEDIAAKVTQLRTLLSNSKSSIQNLQVVSAQLHEALLGDALEVLGNARELLVVPDGVLHLLPFSVLYSKEQQKYLVEDYPIAIAASLRLWSRSSSKQFTTERLAFAGFAYRGLPTAGGNATRSEQQTLPFVIPEVRNAAKVFAPQAAVRIVEAATEDSLKQTIDASVVHVAAHAEIDAVEPAKSYIQLAPSATDRTGRLEFWEAMEQLRLRDSLVVLSACQTGIGPIAAGEGVQALAKAFAFAGASAIVASSWRVNDASASDLMVDFHRRVFTGNSHAQALQRAQIAMRHRDGKRNRSWWERLFGQSTPDYSHPYYWGAFSVTQISRPN